jgi:prolipoprotein diacylglyceryltransferase
MAIYLMAYGVWRFFAEYLRADDRGATVVKFLSPSQLTAILLFLFGAGLMVGAAVIRGKREGEDCAKT